MQNNYYGEYCHYKNKYEDALSEIKYWQDECDRRQHAFNCLASTLKPDASIQDLLDELFPLCADDPRLHVQSPE